MGRPSCTRRKGGIEANKQKADKGYLISLKDRERSDAGHWFCVVWALREGGRGAYLMETHWPALKHTLPSGKLCGKRGRRKLDTHRKTQGKECKREGALRTSKGSIDRYNSSIPTSSTVCRHWMQSRIICFAWDALYPRAFRKRLCATLTGGRATAR
jgi:hypothetical protein